MPTPADTQSLQALFNIQHPILQAPMAGASTPELVCAVSNAGGLGALGAAALPPDRLRADIRAIRQQTDRPFNVNLFAPASQVADIHARPGPRAMALIREYSEALGVAPPAELHSPFADPAAQLEVLLEEKVPVISFHFGVEAEHVRAIHAAGLKVICSATTIEEAVALEALGVDAVIAQGSEAGGHRGTFQGDYRDALIGTLALVPQVVDAVSVPVIAAGGIMDARGIVACRALGAAGAQLGTAFLGCPEAGIPPVWLEQLKSASPSHTTVTAAMSGKPARGLRNRYISDMEAIDEALLPYPLQYALSATIRGEAVKRNLPDFPAMWSGQGVTMLEESSAAALVEKLVRESQALLKNLQ